MYTNGTESVSLHTGPTLPIEEGSAGVWGGGPSRAGSPPPLSDRPTCASVGPSAYLSVPGIDQIPTASVDFRGRLRRTANVQDHVPRSVLRGIDAERHLSLPTLVDGREDLANTVAILLRDVHDTQVQVELVLRWFTPMESQRYRAAQMGARVVQAIDGAPNFEKGVSPPLEVHAPRPPFGHVLRRRQSNFHGTI